MKTSTFSAATSFPAQLVADARAHAATLGIALGPDMVALNQALTAVLLLLVEAGGTWEQVGDQVEWTVFDFDHLARGWDTRYGAVGSDLLLDAPRAGVLMHGAGHFRLQWDGTDFLLAGCSTAQLRTIKGNTEGPLMVSTPRVLLLGPSRARLVALLNALRNHGRSPRVSVWGGATAEALPPETAESAVVLPPALKTDLLTWLDRFWALRDRAQAHHLPLRRGLLLVGEPGTGKTQFIRHLLWRYPHIPAHLYIPARATTGDPFGDMLRAVRQSPEGAIVILEDIDRLADSGTVTTEYLLNCLDGLLEVERPVLWIATANDPTRLESNLLRRPGRFDRTTIFPLPDEDMRRMMIRQFASLPLGDDDVTEAASAAAGLTGAHLRQAVATAMLAVLDSGGDLGPALRQALRQMQAELASVAGYREHLGASRAGFNTLDRGFG